MADPSLVVESGQAKHCQAQLTRLQMALGLKEELNEEGNASTMVIFKSTADCILLDLKKLSYGQKLPAIADDAPTGLGRKGDIILVVLNLSVKYDEGIPIGVVWAVRSLDTALLQYTAPKNFVHQVHRSRTFGGSHVSAEANLRPGLLDSTLGDIRRAINDTLEPMCLDHCGNTVHVNEQSDHSQGKDTFGLCNPRRRVCDNAAHDNDQNNYDHRLHKTCKPRRQIILLLPEKESCLRDLQMLGCDPLKQ